jgi:MFS family permease
VGVVVAGVLPGFLTASQAPRIRDDFSFGDSTLGAAIAVFYVVSALASTPSGRVVERIGARRGMRAAVAAVVVSCLAVALLAHSAAVLIVALVPGALGNALASPAVSPLLQDHVDAERHGLAFGAQQAGAPLGALLAGLSLPAISVPFGWRWSFVAAAALSLAIVAFIPADRTPPARADRAARVRLPRSVTILAPAAALASAAGVGFVSYLVVYGVDQGMSDAAAGLLLAGVSLASATSRLVLGAVADRSRGDPLVPAAGLLAASAAGYLLLIAGQPAVIVVAALLVGALGWSWPGALNLAAVRRAPDAPAHAVGVMLAGLFGGAVGGPLLVGLLAEHGSFTGAWIACAAFALLAAATLVGAIRLSPRPPGPSRR